MYIFDENMLVTMLAKLPRHERIAFAAAAATRQLGNYEWYASKFDPDGALRPREIAKQLWDALAADSVDRNLWALVLDQVMSLLPEEEEDCAICCALADDALSSLAYAVRAMLSPEPQEVAWAARRAYEAADQAAIRTLGVQPGLPNTEIAINSHPFVQREIARQRRDYDLLLARPGEDSIVTIRDYAFSEALLTDKERAFFGMT